MSRRWIICILVLWSLLFSVPPTLQAEHSPAFWLAEGAETSELASPATSIDQLPPLPHLRHEQAAPQKAQDLLAQLQARYGKPLPGYVGGREFRNRERRLPPGRYLEYDVNPKIRGRSRDAERIVIEQDTGKSYYTGDHYRTFVPLNDRP